MGRSSDIIAKLNELEKKLDEILVFVKEVKEWHE